MGTSAPLSTSLLATTLHFVAAFLFCDACCFDWRVRAFFGGSACATTLHNDDKEGFHWFVCAFDCHIRSERFIISVWKPLSSIFLIRTIPVELKRHGFTTEHRALGFQKDGRCCGFQSPHITNVVMDHWGSFSEVHLTPIPPGFADYVLDVVPIALCGSSTRRRFGGGD